MSELISNFIKSIDVDEELKKIENEKILNNKKKRRNSTKSRIK